MMHPFGTLGEQSSGAGPGDVGLRLGCMGGEKRRGYRLLCGSPRLSVRSPWSNPCGRGSAWRMEALNLDQEGEWRKAGKKGWVWVWFSVGPPLGDSSCQGMKRKLQCPGWLLWSILRLDSDP